MSLRKRMKSFLSIVLVIAMVMSFMVPTAFAQESAETRLDFTKIDRSEIDSELRQVSSAADAELESSGDAYAEHDTVRVSIVLDKASTIDAGYDLETVSENTGAIRYRDGLLREQAEVAKDISAEVLNGKTLDVEWNLTLAANVISANVEFGQINSIREINGVRDVVIETRYEPAVVAGSAGEDPLMTTSGKMTGAPAAYAAGYTGAGSRIAIIDTGTDTDHQSFAAEGWRHSIALLAEKAGMSYDEYAESLNLLDRQEIMDKLPQLNIKKYGATAGALYISEKLPFGFNYADGNYDVTNDNVANGHGSHVAGIAAANAYIPNTDGTFSSALESVYVQGIAPDAQIITMNVFHRTGGTYDSDYMVAIEDAIILGCDSINLSLGSAAPGAGRSNYYESVMDSLVDHGAVVCIAAGNSGCWSEHAANGGLLYADDVSFDTVGSPASFTNSLAVASVDNDGYTGAYLKSGDDYIFYYEDTTYGNVSIMQVAGEHEYVFIDGVGTQADWAQVGEALNGKIAICSRGEISFSEKSNNAINASALCTIVYNNQPGGLFGMNLSDIQYEAPCISITQDDGAIIRNNSTPVTDEEGNVLYYTGTLYVSDDVRQSDYNRGYFTMSSFSSWGVPGTLEMKPEITAPGGSIYSVDGLDRSGSAYIGMSGTSMASPQVAGMAALVAQHIRENGLLEKTDLTARQLINSLLMSTAEPITDIASGNYYPVLQQGAGLANVGNAISARSFITMGADANVSYADGKVKAELGDDPARTGCYSFSFAVNNLTDEPVDFAFGAQFFTQDRIEEDGVGYLSTKTRLLPANVTYLVDGKAFVPTAALDCDLDLDGDTDADDAQVILDYLAGLRGSIDTALADVDGSGIVATYDAYLILSSIKCDTVTVPANGKTEVQVQIALPASVKQELNNAYPNGAFVEGYVFTEAVSNSEGAFSDVTHSIPVLGFYGNWSDPSMYDKVSTASYAYGDTTLPYTGEVETNALIYKNAGSQDTYWQIGNPYLIEESYPEGKEAIRSDAKLYKYPLSMIRNAGAVALVITDDEGNYLDASDTSELVSSAYYYTNGNYWSQTVQTFTINRTVKSLGVKEGDRIHVSIVSVPEYYFQEGCPTSEELIALLSSGKLGDGVCLTTSMTIDDTAPVVSKILKNEETGALTVSATDNSYIAYAAILSAGGSRVVKDTAVDHALGETAEITFDLSDTAVGEKCYILVADYAGNESVYAFVYGGEPEDFTGRMFGFTSSSKARGSGKRWLEIDPGNVSYTNESNYTGTTKASGSDIEVLAAEYYNGYVYMAADDGFFYVAPQGEWNAAAKLGYYGSTVSAVYGMAYNYADGNMYVLDDSNGIYTMDLFDGALEHQYTLTIEIDNNDGDWTAYKVLLSIAIDDEGNFYGINKGSYALTRIYQWSNDDLKEDGTMDTLDPKFAPQPIWAKSWAFLTAGPQSLTWDHDNDVLYLANSWQESFGENYLTILDLDTPYGHNPAGDDAGQSVLQCAVRGLYMVPSGKVTPTGTTEEATDILLQPSELSISRGTTTQLTASVFPWNLVDQSVTWTSSDESVVSVDDSGSITARKIGEAEITATTTAEPHLSAVCRVTVTDVVSIDLNALVYHADGSASWAEFNTTNPADYTIAGDGNSDVIAGTLMGDTIWINRGGMLCAVDADFFDEEEVAGLGTLAFSDAAASPSYKKLVCVGGEGLLIEVIDPVSQSASVMDCTSLFKNDPLATIAYVRTEGGGFGFFAKPKTDFFYILTESGKLYSVSYTSNFLGARLSDPVFVADTGLQQTDVSLQAGQYGSMLYNAEHNCLLVASYLDGDSANLYEINLSNYCITDLGSFGAGNWPAVALYQHNRNNAMRVDLDSDYASIFVGDTVKLTASVRPASSTSGVTWSSSDTAIAVVDENGVVTGIADGEAVITATTTDEDSNGNHASATATVNVKGQFSMEGTVNAMINTEEGAKWVDIDLSTLNTTTLAVSDVFLTGGGRCGDTLYGTDSKFDYSQGETCSFYSVDPENSYALHKGSQADASYAILDLTTLPETTFERNGRTYTVGGHPWYVSRASSTVGILDMDEGKIVEYGGLYFFDDAFGAITLKEVTCNSEGSPVYYYYGLTCTGDLYLIRYYYEPDYSGDLLLWTGCEKLGNIGVRFGDNNGYMSYIDKTKMSMANVGGNLVISNEANGSVTLYYVDVNNLKAGAECFGVLEGATGLSCLNTEYDAITEVAPAYSAAADSAGSMTGMLPMEAFAGEQSVASVLNNEELSRTTLASEVSEAKAPVGSTNAVSAKADLSNISGQQNPSSSKIVSIRLTDSVDVTNGLISVSYDPAFLTFVGASSGISNTACRDDENGTIIFDYASAQEITAGNTIAVLTFRSLANVVNTDVSIRTMERNGDAKVNEEETIVHIERAIITTPQDPVVPVIPVLPEEPGENDGFVDVSENDYYYDAVQWAVENGITTGTSDTTFSPNAACTRAQAVTFLWRAAGSPTPKEGVNPFVDVRTGDYYYDAVLWAVEQGITVGTSETTFSPDAVCTRAQIVTFLWRANGKPAADGAASFSDVAADAYYAPAVLWAVSERITVGTGETTFSPDSNCTRAQIVTFLYRNAED